MPARLIERLLGWCCCPNGGNWFKFQSPFVISAEDIDAQRAFVLDLVFNPEGIVKGYAP